ncbi:TolB family protein [Candidatus Entotheonella palauensis]|uniref:TolB family protein n=1 Tax=Candidatus Entotheonella palauensis TaxID=93172 RepID=UPI0011774F82|nr:PD40 domain-containing protein [Candidatus Entotheonella palauensis]
MCRIKHCGFGLVVTLAIWMHLSGFATAAMIQVDSRWDPNPEPMLGGPVTPGCNGEPGIRPLSILIPPGIVSVVIQNTSGAVTYNRRGQSAGPEGVDLDRVFRYESAPGLSGIVSRRRVFLAGVLTANQNPLGASPRDRDGDLGMMSDRLDDIELYQLFAIGRRDGQRPLEIVLPDGAERLWLFAINACVSRGAQLGGYPDHEGSWQVEYTLVERVVPTITLVSFGLQNVQGNGPSEEPSINGDGRFVAFVSNADNLVVGDTNQSSDVFVADRQDRQTTRVSVDSNGFEANSDSYSPMISSDGRYVVFVSDAENLVADDTNGFADIFVHDRQTGQTRRVNVDSTGREANDDSLSPAISEDGQIVVYESFASNLVPDDTNGHQDVFAYEMQTGQTIRVSIDFQGQQIEDESSAPSISQDGRYVAFQTFLGGQNSEILIYDRDIDLVTRLAQGIGLEGVGIPKISGDGQVVTFIGEMSRFLSVYDRQTDQAATINTDVNESASISADGRFVAFGPFDDNFKFDVFVYDRVTNDITLISVGADGKPVDNDSFSPSISAQGRFVAFASNGDNLVLGDNNQFTDVFVYDRGQ